MHIAYRVSLALALGTAPLGAQIHVGAAGPGPREYRIDAGHSDVEFSIGFLTGPVRGRFDDIRGVILYDPTIPESSSVTVVIGAKSIATGSAHRDEHLRSADFFAVDSFPEIVFQSRRITRTKTGFAAVGRLTMHGVTREITIPFREAFAPIADPHGSSLVGFSGEVTLARKDFGILGGATYNPWFDAIRSATMADSAHVTLQVTGWDYDYARSSDVGLKTTLDSIASKGTTAAVAQVRARFAANPAAFKDAEWSIDQAGRALQARGQGGDALEIFRLNAELFPRSPAAQTSLALALYGRGDHAAARAAVERALALDRYDPRALELDRRLRE